MLRILLVENDESQLERMAEILQGAFPSAQILSATGVKQALQAIDQPGAVSLVVADHHLDDGTGYDILSHCVDNVPSVPVIIVTAFGRAEDAEVRPAVSFRKGAFDFINKPIDFDELIERVRRAIRFAELAA